MQIWADQLLLTSEEFLTTWLVLFVSHEFCPFLRPLESSWCSIKKFWKNQDWKQVKKQTKKLTSDHSTLNFWQSLLRPFIYRALTWSLLNSHNYSSVMKNRRSGYYLIRYCTGWMYVRLKKRIQYFEWKK